MTSKRIWKIQRQVNNKWFLEASWSGTLHDALEHAQSLCDQQGNDILDYRAVPWF